MIRLYLRTIIFYFLSFIVHLREVRPRFYSEGGFPRYPFSSRPQPLHYRVLLYDIFPQNQCSEATVKSRDGRPRHGSHLLRYENQTTAVFNGSH